MAAAKKKTTKSTRTTAGKKAAPRKKSAPPRRQSGSSGCTTFIELTGWFMIGLGVTLLIILLPIGSSQLGIRSVIYGLGGWLGFTLPFILMWLGMIVGFSNRRRCDIGQILKIASCILMLFGLFQIFCSDSLLSRMGLRSWVGFIAASYTAQIGGGAIGAAICYPFHYVAGEWGGFALLIFLLAGILFLIYQISLGQMAQLAQERIVDGCNELRKKQSEKSAQRAIAREEKRLAAQQRAQQQAEYEAQWDEFEDEDDFDPDAGSTTVKPLRRDVLEVPERMADGKSFLKRPAFGDAPAAGKKTVKKAPAKTPHGRQSMHGTRPEPSYMAVTTAYDDAASDAAPTPAAKPQKAAPAKPAPVVKEAVKPVFVDLEEDPADSEVYDIPEDTFETEDRYEAVEPVEPSDDVDIDESPSGLLPFPTFEGAQRESRRKEAAQPAPVVNEGSASSSSKQTDAPKQPETRPTSPQQVVRQQDGDYNYPPVDLLAPPVHIEEADRSIRDAEKQRRLHALLENFGISAKMLDTSHGPAVTRFELAPAPGVRVSRISALADDIALSLAAMSVRIEAPIPGKAAIGVEIPNDVIETVSLREVLESDEARNHPSRLAVCMGKDNSGRYIVGDIAKMPHVLIAGATGSGKSVCINCVICSILYRATPDEVRLIMIDPKMVELSIYNGIPHLLVPVVTDPKKAAGALQWAVSEMTDRYNKFAERGVRDMKGYNAACKDGEKPLPQIVIIIDELADLMMVAPGEVEDAICRLAQLARAAGIHLVIATQRPSVNVITGVIKANIPARIAFTVSSQVDSRTILDVGGAEKLLGRGDMLFAPAGSNRMQRVQGAWVSDDEVHSIVDYIKQRYDADYNEAVIEHMNKSEETSDTESEDSVADEMDPLLQQAIEIVIEAGQASISMLQRRMRIGYARAGRLIDEMAARGIVSQSEGAKPRNVLITREQYASMFHTDSES